MERCILFCLLWILSICSHHVDCSKIFTEEQQERIVGGTAPARMPWMAAVRLQIPQGTFHTCGGFIINQRWIGTAATCLESKTIQNTLVAVGSNALAGGDIYGLQRWEIHTDFSQSTFVNDIALLRTDRQIVFSTAVNAIHLATNNTFIGTGVVTTFGWGSISSGGNFNTVLQQATFTAITNAVCLTRFPFVARRFITDRHICTQAATVATCPGDGGGPIVFNNAVVGIVSWVEPCVAGQTNVNTRITFYVDWIWSHTRADD